MHKYSLLIIFSFLGYANQTFATISDIDYTRAQQILSFIDKGKSDDRPFTLKLSIKDLSSGKEQAFQLKDDGNSNTVLEFLDKRQRGQKILSTENDVWFFSKRTRRAIKIPPIQRLFGDANIGDISRLRFATDYKPIAYYQHNDAIQLKLTSKNMASTYHQVNLWVNPKSYLPIKANFYSVAGKHIKSATFIDVAIVDDTPVINHWELTTPNKNNKTTQVISTNFSFIDVSPVEFTKAYLELNK